jgi:drug/metabolite transporter (DMT)-like permease
MRLAVLLVLAIGVQAVGNLLLSLGMKEVASFGASHPDQWQSIVLEVITRPANNAGAHSLVAFSILFATALSRADLSFAMPVVSIEIVVNVALAHLVLGEEVSLKRWLGVCLVALGVTLVSLSARQGPALGATGRAR